MSAGHDHSHAPANTATALLFMRGREGDLNIRGAYLHMAADAGVSVGVVVAALAMQYFRRDMQPRTAA